MRELSVCRGLLSPPPGPAPAAASGSLGLCQVSSPLALTPEPSPNMLGPLSGSRPPLPPTTALSPGPTWSPACHPAPACPRGVLFVVLWAQCVCVRTHARVCVCQCAGVFLGSLVTGQAVSLFLGVCLTLAGGAGVLKGPLICSDRPGCRGPGEGRGLQERLQQEPRAGAAGEGASGRPGGVGVGTREEEGPAGGAGGSESAGRRLLGWQRAERSSRPWGPHRGCGRNHGPP